MSSPGRPPVVSAVVEEHRYLRRVVHELSETAIHTPPVEEGGPWCADLAGRLHDLAAHLERHFRAEDAPDGLYAHVLKALPQASAEVAALQAQHERLLAGFRTLAEGAGRTPLDQEALYRLAAHIAAAVSELVSHEANESDVMLRVAHSAANTSSR
jgi:hemerythrin HHE cation binding domain-containing protein